ncbi:ABC transporter ATP-binding protein [Desulfosarcina alkanivorans]|uniref:ABC transporter ATP-binding protein n=1 Tax=Desulfosarcina alkanivorans TaxID=571177 RepID=A0A5K7Z096_9BACT|nr:ABC transporter ATP-binding protein [Desulfosarcina alkanivorans]BBO70257.1 ABC transporter ATP-binding protein [Desulfosarcina alkanivorans]
MGLKLENVSKVVDGETHLHQIDLVFETGSRNVLLGRTLSGKTTLLRIMAGLDRPTNGKIVIDGKDMTGVSVRKRSIAMVYQQFINYPSLSVYDNIASPLKIGGIPKKEIDRRVRETAEMLHLEGMLDRIPAELSGGQQQRTAIARALVKEAQLLLLDEPLVNLDYKLREELRVELQDIFRKRSAIVVYTTTEPSEALMLGGNVVVLDEGQVMQTGATAMVYQRPETLRAAEVFSDPPINALDSAVTEDGAVMGDNIPVPLTGHMADLASGSYRFAFRSNHLWLSSQTEEDLAITGTVELSEINGSETFVYVHHGKSAFVVQQYGVHPFSMGNEITVYINPKHLFVYDTAGRLVAAPPAAGPSA